MKIEEAYETTIKGNESRITTVFVNTFNRKQRTKSHAFLFVNQAENL